MDRGAWRATVVNTIERLHFHFFFSVSWKPNIVLLDLSSLDLSFSFVQLLHFRT